MQRKVFFLACLFIGASCLAQQYSFAYYTPKDGLINSRVRSTMQDSKGRMYFVTFGGLSVYDGARFTNYNKQDGLAVDLVNDIAEAGPDSFLVATNANRLNTLVNGKIGDYKTTDNFCPIINRLLKSKDGFWYVAADEGLFVLKNKKFLRLAVEKDKKDISIYLERIIEHQHYFLLASWGGNLAGKLILYNKITGAVDDLFITEGIACMRTDNEGVIWVITPSGVKQIDGAALVKGKIVLRAMPSPYSLIPKTSSGLYFDTEGNSWFFGGRSVQKITPQKNIQTMAAEQGLKTSNVSSLFQDREGILWMATDGHSVIKLKNTNVQLFTTILPPTEMAFATLCQQGDTTWLFNYNDHLLYRETPTEVKSFAVPSSFTPANIMLLDSSLLMQSAKKIIAFKNKDERNSYEHPVTILNEPKNFLGCQIKDAYGAIIQLRQTPDSSFLVVIKNGKTLMHHAINFCDQMAIDGQRRLWIATRENHIMVFSLNPADPLHYLQRLKDFSKEFTGFSFRSITIDKQNTIWAGTRYSGLYKIRVVGSEVVGIQQFTTKSGLTDNFVCQLACDSNNTIWVGTQTGLDKIFLKNGEYVVANISRSNNVFQSVLKIDFAKDGTVMALNNDGTILKILPQAANKTALTPLLLLTSIKVNNIISNSDVKQFSYQQNNFSFTAAAPSFIEENAIHYSYLLEGSGNKTWSEPSNLSAFSFINLGSGKYTLQVRATFPEAMYPPQTLRYHFTISEPWFNTWWFKLAMGLLIAGFMFLIIRSYYKRKLQKQQMLLEKKQAVEKERTRIAADMHDDLGAGLSRIKFLSETIGIKKQQHQPIEEDISKIKEYSHQMIDKMGEIVWALNQKNDSLSDLLSYTRAYAVEYLEQENIICHVEWPHALPTIFVSGEFRRNIFLSVKEILHNVVKHSGASNVWMLVFIHKNLQISIQDDGQGFNVATTRTFSNGLPNIKKRMADINGRMEIKMNVGTTIILTAPLPQ